MFDTLKMIVYKFNEQKKQLFLKKTTGLGLI